MLCIDIIITAKCSHILCEACIRVYVVLISLPLSSSIPSSLAAILRFYLVVHVCIKLMLNKIGWSDVYIYIYNILL